MSNITKGSVVFKHIPQDFIVEEICEEHTCKVSDELSKLNDSKVNFGKLNVEDRRDFLMCELEKYNIDHYNMLSILCREIGNFPHHIGFAGTKDKIAWSCQRISIFNANISKIRDFHYQGILLKNFKWIKHKIKIGDLTSNHFKITLRDADSDALKILNRVRNTEFIPNLFGMQRFGSLREDNLKIGKLILQKKYNEAVLALLTGFGDKESDEVIKSKLKFRSEKDFSKAMKYFPIELKMEHLILKHLSEFKDDWIGALKTIDEKVLLIMCQSVQSKIFNDLLERAIDEGQSIHNLSLPILGYDYIFSEGVLGQLEKDTLKMNNLRLSDFKSIDFPFLNLNCSSRPAFFKVHNLRAETEDDELFPRSKKIIIDCILDSGSYATTLLENFFVLR